MNSLLTYLASPFRNNSSAAILSRCAFFFICLLSLSAGKVSAQEARPSEPNQARSERTGPSGAITGRVTSEDGRPFPDAVITFFKAYARQPSQQRTATSDSEGKFKIEGLEPGLYMVGARVLGFVNAHEPVPGAGEDSLYKPGDSVSLTLIKGGVITGTVRDANGEPIVAVPVRAMRVRDANGKPRLASTLVERTTDDRGVYRIYGLPPGTYVVSAGSSRTSFGDFNPYDGDAPTFFPSSTRDTAGEIPVRGGEEITGIDIRYRGERGHMITGTVSGINETEMRFGVTITLRQTMGGGYEALSFVGQGMKPSFAFEGVADGEYEISAQQWSGTGDTIATLPHRITVKGNDVTGVALTLAPLGSITGQATLEDAPKENCANTANATLFETSINALLDVKRRAETSSMFFSSGGSLLTGQGEFSIGNLLPGNYRLTSRLPSEAWYIRSVQLPAGAIAAAAARPSPAPAKSAGVESAQMDSAITLKTGVRIAGVNVQIAQDGASLRGRLLSATEGSALPQNLKVYLVPTERERAQDVLRYSEASLGAEGAFTLKNLAPGRYWLIARPTEEGPVELALRPLAWDAQERARLRREAEAANTTIELKPCQRVTEYTLRYAAAK